MEHRLGGLAGAMPGSAYTVERLLLDGGLKLRVSPGLAEGGLVLRIAGESFPLAGATSASSGAGREYAWSRRGLYWRHGQRVSVSLAPSGAQAKGYTADISAAPAGGRDTGRAQSRPVGPRPGSGSGGGGLAVTFAFDRAVTGFTWDDIAVGNGAVWKKRLVRVDGATYTAVVAPAAGGEVTVRLPAGAVEDANGVPNDASERPSARRSRSRRRTPCARRRR